MFRPDTLRPQTEVEFSLTQDPSAAKSLASPLPLPTRIAFIGNYLPRQCGIATFTTDLCTAVAAEYGDARLFAIPVNDPDSSYDYPERVRLELSQEDPTSYERAAEFLNFNGNDLVCMQHEYGIFGGIAGSHILSLLRKLKMPLGDDTSYGSARAGFRSACRPRRDCASVRSFDRNERACRLPPA